MQMCKPDYASTLWPEAACKGDLESSIINPVSGWVCAALLQGLQAVR